MKKLFILLPLSIVLVFCTQDNNPSPSLTETYGASTVLRWNDAACTAVARTGGMPPMTESRLYAMVNVAVHDALNNIVRKYETYALDAPAVANADPDAAVAQAAHDVMVAVLPGQTAFADSLLVITLSAITEGDSKTAGIEVGRASAVAMLAGRNGDGASIAQHPWPQGTQPGEYRSTPPFEAAGLVFLPGWGKVKPFCLSGAAQFRPAAPHPVTSAAYTADFNEVKTLGAATGSDRTTDQTQIGIFWLENVPFSANRIVRVLASQKNLTGWQTARLLALMQMAQADANIAVFEAKYFYNFWRPVTAVRAGDADGNTATTGAPAWNVLAPPTPPVPDHPSNHAADGGAAMELLKLFFGRDDVSFSLTSTTLPGVTRNFSSLSQAATEISLSRIYVGYHYRKAVVDGEDMGRKIGRWIWENALRER